MPSNVIAGHYQRFRITSMAFLWLMVPDVHVIVLTERNLSLLVHSVQSQVPVVLSLNIRATETQPTNY